jgi:hypothetical protein
LGIRNLLKGRNTPELYELININQLYDDRGKNKHG